MSNHLANSFLFLAIRSSGLIFRDFIISVRENFPDTAQFLGIGSPGLVSQQLSELFKLTPGCDHIIDVFRVQPARSWASHPSLELFLRIEELSTFFGNTVDFFTLLLISCNVPNLLEHLQRRVNTTRAGDVEIIKTFLQRPDYLIPVTRLVFYTLKYDILEISPLEGPSPPRGTEITLPLIPPVLANHHNLLSSQNWGFETTKRYIVSPIVIIIEPEMPVKSVPNV